MNKGLTRTTASLLFLLFVGGTILLPSFHRAHCDANHATRAAAQCPICQFANTPVITTASHIAPIGVAVVVCDSVLPPLPVTCPPLRGAAQARAPPVA